MPYIGLKTNCEIDKAKEISIKTKLGKAIETFPGKSEAWLMCEFCDNCRLYLSGDNSEKIAFVQVKIYGNPTPADCDKMTGAICDILKSELGISPDKVYVTYSGFSQWGWNGSNF